MTINLQRELIEEIAVEYGFDVERLCAALSRAIEAHHDEQKFLSLRGNAATQIGSTKPALVASRRALDRWEELPTEAKREVAKFIDPSNENDPIGPKLRFVFELLEEYGEHYRRRRGNPGRSRTNKDANRLEPLKEFSRVLMNFWDEEKGTPFGHVIERQLDIGGVNPLEDTTAPPDAKSPAMKFLHHAGMVLHPTNYSIENFETVIRDLKRNPHRQ